MLDRSPGDLLQLRGFRMSTYTHLTSNRVDRLTEARQVEIQRAANSTWGIEPEELSLGELFLFFCGMAIVLTVVSVPAAYAINALRAAGVL